METIKDIWVNDHLGKLEFRVDKTKVTDIEELTFHKVVIASITMGGEPIYTSPPMTKEDAMQLYDVMLALYDKA